MKRCIFVCLEWGLCQEVITQPHHWCNYRQRGSDKKLYKLSNLRCSKFKGILVKTPYFQCRGGAVAIPDWGNNILHALWHGPKQTNKKNHKASDHTESSGIKTNT